MRQVPLETESTLTERFQTTVPSVVRKALHLGKGDKIKFTIDSDGKVVLAKVESAETDPAIDAFLTFLSSDMQQHPERIQAVSLEMKASAISLLGGIDKELDLNAPLLDEEE